MAVRSSKPVKFKKVKTAVKNRTKGSVKIAKNRGGGAGALNQLGSIVFREINGNKVPIKQKRQS